MNELSGKTVLITGGSSGIGLATAQLFVEHGARVAITGRDQASLDDAHRTLGGDILALRSDAGSVAAIEQLMATVSDHFGHLDVLFLNAAAGTPAPIEHATEQQFDSLSDISFKGVFFAIQKAAPLMRPGSSIIVTTSISNQVGAPNFSVYAACKAAARSLVQSASLELAHKQIRVNAISPGPVDTPGFGRWGVPQAVVDAARADLTNRSPSKRFGTAREIANAALFLASDASTYVMGAELVVDGGLSIQL